MFPGNDATTHRYTHTHRDTCRFSNRNLIAVNEALTEAKAIIPVGDRLAKRNITSSTFKFLLKLEGDWRVQR